MNSKHPKIINLSHHQLGKAEKEVLTRGLKFTPTPKSNQLELKEDIYNLERKVRLTEYFLDKVYVEDSIVKNPSLFTPNSGRDKEMDMILNNIKKQIPPPPKKIHRNIKKTEEIAIKQLKENKNIVIKEADKGGSVIVMDNEFYRAKLEEHLSDPETYRKIEGNIPNIHKKIEELLNQYQDHLTEKEIEYLHNFESKNSIIYGLPKVHKSKMISEAIEQQNQDTIHILNPADLKFRPIIAGPINPTSHLSNFIHIILKPYLEEIPSFIKDSQTFLQSLPPRIDSESILVTLDIVSLYTSIPHNLGLEAVEFWLDKFPDRLHYRIPKSFILEAISLILTNNYFEFNNQIYLQLQGTAMGTKMAPTYANMTVGFLEWKLYQKLNLTSTKEDCLYIHNNWKRYLDDCFIIWNKNKTELDQFISQINNLHHSIQFTSEINSNSIPFLDIKIIKKGENIETDIYRKPTDTLNYIDFHSCHPRHTRINIPYTLATRIVNIVSNKHQQVLRLRELQTILLKKNYPYKLIQDAIQKALDIRTQPKKSSQPPKKILPFITTHNPNNPNIFNRTKLLLSTGTSSTMTEINNRFRLLNSQRQPKNLKKLLTRAKFSSETEEGGSFKCQSPRCGTCPLIQSTSSVTFKNKPDSPFFINKRLSCTTKNVVYVIICPQCKKEYIGQTSDLRFRVTVHKQQIRDSRYRKLPVSKHLYSCNKDPNVPFRICPLIVRENEIARKILETHLIHKFQPELNNTE